MNTFGTNLRVSIFGESHGAQIGITIDGIPAGLPIEIEDFTEDLARRRSGSKGTTTRKETDIPTIVSGLYQGHATGAPMTIIFNNNDTRSSDYANLADHPRPSHADMVARQKFHSMNDPRGGGHFSGRITAPLVAAGVVAKKILTDSITITATATHIGGQPIAAAEAVIEQAMRESDSVGGVIECRVTGLPAGLGEPFFDSVESVISHAVFSVPAVRAIEFGRGFAAAQLKGSEHNDPIMDSRGTTKTNNAAGIVGGITNGNEILLRVAIKPTASIAQPQQTYNFETDTVDTLRIKGRHDTCIALRAPVVIEAAVALALAQFK